MTLQLKRTENDINRIEREGINGNWKKIEDNFNNVVEVISNNALEEVINGSRFVWQTPVANFSSIVTTYPNPEEGWAVQTTDDGKVYRYSGTAWEYKQQIDAGPVNALSTQVDEEITLIGVTPEKFGATGSPNDDTSAIQQAINEAATLRTKVVLTGDYSFTNLTIPSGVFIIGRRRATLRHTGSGIGIASGATGNALNTVFEDIMFRSNVNTSILFDTSGLSLFNFNRCSFFGDGSTGMLVKCGRGDELNKSGYYNNFNACYFNGDTDGNGNMGQLIGAFLTNSSNSTRFNDCRFDFISRTIVGDANTNNNTFVSCAFENFVTAIESSGRAYVALGCRFELPTNSTGTAFLVSGPGFYNSVYGCHFQGISSANKFRDNSNSGLNFYVADAIAKMPETNFDNRFISNIRTMGLSPQSEYYANPLGSMIFYGNEYTGDKGLFFNDGARKKVQLVTFGTTANRPATQTTGETYVNATVNRQQFYNGTTWISNAPLYEGSGSPEGVVSAARGAFYTDTTNNVPYWKQTVGGNAGWRAITLT